MIERIIYENALYYYIGMSNGEYVYRHLNSNYFVRFTPGMFDLMKAHGLIKEG